MTTLVAYVCCQLMIFATYQALSREQYVRYTKFLCVTLAIHCIRRSGNNTWWDEKRMTTHITESIQSIFKHARLVYVFNNCAKLGKIGL